MADERENVVRQIRESLSEFAERNGAELSEKQMDNLAYWVAGVVPSNHFRVACPGLRMAEEDGSQSPVACACPGICQRWVRIDAATAGLLSAEQLSDEAAPLGGSWTLD